MTLDWCFHPTQEILKSMFNSLLTPKIYIFSNIATRQLRLQSIHNVFQTYISYIDQVLQ